MAEERDSQARLVAVVDRDPAQSQRLSRPGSRPDSRYLTGDLIGEKYRLLDRLGIGGMGEVWLARNETLDIHVAIKVIRADADQSDSSDRLLREAQAAARLAHTAIVRIFDFGKTGAGDPYIVMEHLEGEDLATALTERGRMSAIKAVRTLLPIAHALAEVHAKGMVHRDLKPENIFLQRIDGEQDIRPKLLDFGVAKIEQKHDIRLTQSGALLGSPLYMAPEQARGDDVDQRSDVWSLCVLLYELITGHTPFEGKNHNAVMFAIVTNRPAPITDQGAGDEVLSEIIERGLEKDPDRRWHSMMDLGAALAGWLQERGVFEDIAGASLEAAWLGRAVISVAPPPMSRRSLERGPSPLQATLRGKRHASAVSKWGLLGIGLGVVAIAAIAAMVAGEFREPSSVSRPGDGVPASGSPAPSDETALPAAGAAQAAPSPLVPTAVSATAAEQPPSAPDAKAARSKTPAPVRPAGPTPQAKSPTVRSADNRPRPESLLKDPFQ